MSSEYSLACRRRTADFRQGVRRCVSREAYEQGLHTPRVWYTRSLEAWHREGVLEHGLPASASCTATSADEPRSELEQMRGSGYAAISVAGPLSRAGATLTTTPRDEVIAAAEWISAELRYLQARRDREHALASRT